MYIINAANLLTSIRIAMVPFFVFFIKFENSGTCKIISLIIFILACLTDAIDGFIARKFNLISNFGKFLDPLADKILITSAMVCCVELKLIDSVFLILILIREFLVTSLRLSAALKNKVIAASWLGKIKTVLQIITIILVLFEHTFSLSSTLKTAASWAITVATAATIVSGIAYFVNNFKYIY